MTTSAPTIIAVLLKTQGELVVENDKGKIKNIIKIDNGVTTTSEDVTSISAFNAIANGGTRKTGLDDKVTFYDAAYPGVPLFTVKGIKHKLDTDREAANRLKDIHGLAIEEIENRKPQTNLPNTGSSSIILGTTPSASTSSSNNSSISTLSQNLPPQTNGPRRPNTVGSAPPNIGSSSSTPNTGTNNYSNSTLSQNLPPPSNGRVPLTNSSSSILGTTPSASTSSIINSSNSTLSQNLPPQSNSIPDIVVRSCRVSPSFGPTKNIHDELEEIVNRLESISIGDIKKMDMKDRMRFANKLSGMVASLTQHHGD